MRLRQFVVSFLLKLTDCLTVLLHASPIFFCISRMALCDMMVNVGLMGIALRFLDIDQQKTILWCQVVAQSVLLLVLTSPHGTMMQDAQLQASAIGTFISLTVAVVGAVN